MPLMQFTIMLSGSIFLPLFHFNASFAPAYVELLDLSNHGTVPIHGHNIMTSSNHIF